MTTTLRALVLVVVPLLFPACGDDGPSAEAQCNELFELLCGHAEACGVESFDTCRAMLNAAVPCERAVEVKDTYEGCKAEVVGQSCEQLFPGGELGGPPASCRGVIVTAGQ